MSSPNDYSDSSSFNTGFYIPIMIALIGAVLGIVGIVLAMQAQKAADAANDALKSNERLAAEVKEELHEMDQRVVSLTARLQQVSQQNPSTQIIEQIRPAFNNLEQRLQGTEQGQRTIVEQIAKLGPVIEELDRRTTELAKGRGGIPAASSATGTASAAASSAGTQAVASNESVEASAEGGEARPGIYRVKPGDNFSGIARRFKIPLNTLINANLGVDYNRLQIGQEIVIP